MQETWFQILGWGKPGLKRWMIWSSLSHEGLEGSFSREWEFTREVLGAAKTFLSGTRQVLAVSISTAERTGGDKYTKLGKQMDEELWKAVTRQLKGKLHRGEGVCCE